MAKGSSSRLKPVQRSEEVEDDYLESDDEVDEFAEDYDSSLEGAGNGEDLLDPNSEEEEGEEGKGRWEADNWNEDQDDNTDSDSDSDSDVSGSDGESGSDDEEDLKLKRLQNDLTSLPLSTLAKAQKSISKQRSSSSSSSGTGSSKEDRLLAAKAKLAQLQKGKGKAITIDPYSQSTKSRDGNRGNQNGTEDGGGSDSDSGPETGSTKRGSKHAPVAMSTKKQVSRSRKVVDTHKPDRRDPRFSSVSAGNLDAHLHSQSYSFIPSLLKEELSSLKKSLSVAMKLERTCPWAEKPQRTAEREEIELKLGQVRTKLVRTERENRERDVLAKFKKEERGKREEGKGAWYMKNSEKRDLLLKSKFESLEKQGGKSAVKKAMEKKRKKIASKEKKSRPFARGQGDSGGGGDRKRQRV
ncbi:uncharacterized protein IL334_006655 [Kwoniella shivajii]|uniref:rRNA biogenesis protein RRP36 n=1 Tax=Kwoniella shivajii TaxID=564305 RepID=A0ABZ1D8H5_9TREE|nr:hypothetical protein IL334_006655 [Kwoniella shivajii]